MQAKLSYLRTVVAVLIASLVLSACSGNGEQGSTWFNFPSVPVDINADGTASVLGFNIGYIGLQPSLIAQLQAANVQELEIRIGHNGIFIFANGEALPYIAWNNAAVDTLQTVLRNTTMVQNGDTIATLLPWLRRIGTGARLELPLAQGATALNIPRWRGETLVADAGEVETTIGPINISSLAFDQTGNASFAGIPLADLGAGFNLPPDVLQILQSLNAQQVMVDMEPTGIHTALNGNPFLTIAYDEARLTRALALAQPILGDSPMATTIANLGPQLVGADVTLNVSFTGEPAGPTQIAAVPIQVQEDGTLNAFGLPVGASLPADLLQALQAAGAQFLAVNVEGNSLKLAMDGEPLPVISWSDSALNLLQSVAGDLGISPATLTGGLTLLQNLTAESPLGLTLALPGAEGTAAPEADFSTLPAPESIDMAEPDIQIGAVLENNQLQSVAGLPVSTLNQLGVQVPALPDNVTSVLNSLGASQVQVANTGDALAVLTDGQILLSLAYDQAALERLITLAGAVADNAAMVETVQGMLPLLTGQQLNLVVSLDGGEAPATRLADVPVTVGADGDLLVYGMDLGLESGLPTNVIADLQDANIQRLDLDIADDTLYLATNGAALPRISWNEASLALVQRLAGSMLSMSPELLGTALDLIQSTDVGLQVSLPPAEGSEAVQVPEEFDVTQVELQTPELGDISQPVVQLSLVYAGGELQEVGGVPAAVVRAMGVPIPDLPPDLVRLLKEEVGTDQIQLTTEPNALNIGANGETLLTIHYDAATLQQALQLAEPFLPEQTASFLQDSAVTTLLQQNILPLVAGADVNVTADLQ